jgi:hypothetical protein
MNIARRVEKLLPFDTCAKGTTVINVAVMLKGLVL